jgi:hypothetical protein
MAARSDTKASTAAAARATFDTSEASNYSEQLRCMVQALHANTAETQSETNCLRVLISNHESDSR